MNPGLIFSTNDNTDVNTLFNMFLNYYLRISYTSFPLKNVAQKGNKNQWIIPGVTTSYDHKKCHYLLSKDSNDTNSIRHYTQ
jgi:hypothetical protein